MFARRDGERLRAGGIALRSLFDAERVEIMRLLAEGPALSDALAGAARYVSRSSRFDRLRAMQRDGLVGVRKSGAPPVTEYSLTAPGRGLLAVADALEAWLSRNPRPGAARLEEPGAAQILKALASAWGSALLRWIADAPRSPTQIAPLLEGVSYPTLERRLAELTSLGLAERASREGQRHPYAATLWARRSLAPLAVAMRWERRHVPRDAVPPAALELETGLLLALPLLRLSPRCDGEWTLAVDGSDCGTPLAGLTVRLGDGRAIATASISGPPYLRGTVADWLDAVIDGRPDLLACSGGAADARETVLRLHSALFAG